MQLQVSKSEMIIPPGARQVDDLSVHVDSDDVRGNPCITSTLTQKIRKTDCAGFTLLSWQVYSITQNK